MIIHVQRKVILAISILRSIVELWERERLVHDTEFSLIPTEPMTELTHDAKVVLGQIKPETYCGGKAGQIVASTEEVEHQEQRYLCIHCLDAMYKEGHRAR